MSFGRFAGKTAVVTGGALVSAPRCAGPWSARAPTCCAPTSTGRPLPRLPPRPGSGARAARLDVTDAAAVQAAVDGVVARAGRLDLMFNNAGIAWGGDTELLTLDQWNAIIDVNIRGVVHGVAAAYP